MPSLLECYQDDAHHAGEEIQRLKAENEMMCVLLEEIVQAAPEPEGFMWAVIPYHLVERAKAISAYKERDPCARPCIS